MLGSHNSLTGYPCPWYLRPFNVFSKCQSKTIEGQFESGVRFFDIRIKMKPDGRYCFAHGLMKYKCRSLTHIIDTLHDCATDRKTDVFYRVLLEYGREPERYGEIRRCLTDLLAYRPFSNVRFCGAYAKWNCEETVRPDAEVPITHKYSSCIGWKRFIHCVPCLYAKRHNKEFKEQYKDILDSDDKVLLLDFA